MEFSHRNIYNSERYRDFIGRQCYVLTDDKFFSGIEKYYELSDDFSVEVKTYLERSKKYNTILVHVDKCTLKKSGKEVYTYLCFGGESILFKDIIHHKNGHRYYPFHVWIFGISFLDVDTLEVYNYIPQGDSRGYIFPCGESLVINNIYYDKESNLIAYGGRYRSGTVEVMVGDFSEPLNFNPHLVKVSDTFNFPKRDIRNPDCAFYYEIYFKEWKDGRLYVCGDTTEKSISVDELKEMINKLTIKGEK